jgi:hypothetical protein
MLAPAPALCGTNASFRSNVASFSGSGIDLPSRFRRSTSSPTSDESSGGETEARDEQGAAEGNTPCFTHRTILLTSLSVQGD